MCTWSHYDEEVNSRQICSCMYTKDTLGGGGRFFTWYIGGASINHSSGKLWSIYGFNCLCSIEVCLCSIEVCVCVCVWCCGHEAVQLVLPFESTEPPLSLWEGGAGDQQVSGSDSRSGIHEVSLIHTHSLSLNGLWIDSVLSGEECGPWIIVLSEDSTKFCVFVS